MKAEEENTEEGPRILRHYYENFAYTVVVRTRENLVKRWIKVPEIKRFFFGTLCSKPLVLSLKKVGTTVVYFCSHFFRFQKDARLSEIKL